MLILSGATDNLVSWSDFSLLHKQSENQKGSVVKLFKLLQDLSL